MERPQLFKPDITAATQLLCQLPAGGSVCKPDRTAWKAGTGLTLQQQPQLVQSTHQQSMWLRLCPEFLTLNPRTPAGTASVTGGLAQGAGCMRPQLSTLMKDSTTSTFELHQLPARAGSLCSASTGAAAPQQVVHLSLVACCREGGVNEALDLGLHEGQAPRQCLILIGSPPLTGGVPQGGRWMRPRLEP